MRSMGRMIVAFGALALLASPAMAQGFRGGFGGPALLTNKGVQTELKLEQDQVTKVEKIAADMGAKQRETFQSLQGATREERQEKMRALTEETNKALADVLKPEQMKRYEQITIQTRGVQAFSDPEVQTKLALTDDQKQKIQAIAEDSGAQTREIFQSAGDDREAAMRKITTLRKESVDKAVAVLTDDQKTSWKELTGAPFEVRFERRPGGQ